jgi:hypothetical protein
MEQTATGLESARCDSLDGGRRPRGADDCSPMRQGEHLAAPSRSSTPTRFRRLAIHKFPRACGQQEAATPGPVPRSARDSSSRRSDPRANHYGNTWGFASTSAAHRKSDRTTVISAMIAFRGEPSRRPAWLNDAAQSGLNGHLSGTPVTEFLRTVTCGNTRASEADAPPQTYAFQVRGARTAHVPPVAARANEAQARRAQQTVPVRSHRRVGYSHGTAARRPCVHGPAGTQSRRGIGVSVGYLVAKRPA